MTILVWPDTPGYVSCLSGRPELGLLNVDRQRASLLEAQETIRLLTMERDVLKLKLEVERLRARS